MSTATEYDYELAQKERKNKIRVLLMAICTAVSITAFGIFVAASFIFKDTSTVISSSAGGTPSSSSLFDVSRGTPSSSSLFDVSLGGGSIVVKGKVRKGEDLVVLIRHPNGKEEEVGPLLYKIVGDNQLSFLLSSFGEYTITIVERSTEKAVHIQKASVQPPWLATR